MLSRVLGIANTVAHNPGFTPLASVAHAIHQIGFTRVRNLALSLMLVENAGPRNAAEQREAAAQALCAGLLAQGCAQSLGSIDPDLAFACAALRNFGNILLPAVSIDHYREVTWNVLKTQSEDVAYRGVFGLTPLELSRKILAPSKLPEEITRSLRDCKPEAMGGIAASTYDAKLLGVADFGGQLAKITLDGTSSADSFAERSRALARRYEKIIPGANDAIEPALLHTDDRIASFTQNNGSGVTCPTSSLRRIKDRVTGQAPGTSTYGPAQQKRTPRFPLRPKKATHCQSRRSIPSNPSNRHRQNQRPLTLRQSKILPRQNRSKPRQLPPKTPAMALPPNRKSQTPESWSDALSKSPEFETQPETVPATEAPTDPWSAALKFVHDGFGAQECWLFLPQNGGESLPLTQGIGAHWKEFKKSAALRLGSPSEPFLAYCLTRRENVVIHDTTAATLTPYLPAWFRKTSGAPGAFLLMPLHDEKNTHGLILIGWEQTAANAVSPAQTELARQMFASVSASERTK